MKVCASFQKQINIFKVPVIFYKWQLFTQVPSGWRFHFWKNEISFHLVNFGPIRMKLSGIFSETHSCRKKKRAWSWCKWGGKLYLYLHQSIFRLYTVNVKKNLYRPKNIIPPIGTKNSANRCEFSSSPKWNLSHLKQCNLAHNMDNNTMMVIHITNAANVDECPSLTSPMIWKTTPWWQFT